MKNYRIDIGFKKEKTFSEKYKDDKNLLRKK